MTLRPGQFTSPWPLRVWHCPHRVEEEGKGGKGEEVGVAWVPPSVWNK